MMYLRKNKAVPVALMTPYGATKSDFMAVSKDYKLAGAQIVPGRVGHDRIQQAKATESIGEAIRKWYKLPAGYDFERIDVDIEVRDSKFYITPVGYRLVGRSRSVEVPKPVFPLSFHRNFQSHLWRNQLKEVQKENPTEFKWALEEIRRIASAHEKPRIPNVLNQIFFEPLVH